MKQLNLLANENSAYGGELMTTRKGRSRPRPLAVRSSMHLVLRSSQAKGKWSFLRPANRRKVAHIVNKFAKKYAVRLISMANVGNHLHLHIQLTNRQTYRPFIRAITSAIAMAISGVSRWNKAEEKFWDYRPYTRVVIGWRALLNLKDYIRINRLEGYGYRRDEAVYLVKRKWQRAAGPPRLALGP